MSKYKTRSEKLLNLLTVLDDRGEVSVLELRGILGSLVEAKALVSLLLGIDVCENIIKVNRETGRKAEYLRFIDGWSIDPSGLERVNEYVMGSREAEKYVQLRDHLILRSPGEEGKHEAGHHAPASVTLPVVGGPVEEVSVSVPAEDSSRPDPKVADKFVKHFLDVADIASRQHSEKMKAKNKGVKDA
ncbi:hypothetical protein ACFLRF_02820 [Candidatus Altiarchaeota archaeon]